MKCESKGLLGPQGMGKTQYGQALARTPPTGGVLHVRIRAGGMSQKWHTSTVDPNWCQTLTSGWPSRPVPGASPEEAAGPIAGLEEAPEGLPGVNCRGGLCTKSSLNTSDKILFSFLLGRHSPRKGGRFSADLGRVTTSSDRRTREQLSGELHEAGSVYPNRGFAPEGKSKEQ